MRIAVRQPNCLDFVEVCPGERVEVRQEIGSRAFGTAMTIPVSRAAHFSSLRMSLVFCSRSKRGCRWFKWCQPGRRDIAQPGRRREYGPRNETTSRIGLQEP